ncbi:MAG: class I SAM-dependent DNA methyltransferase, partial [Aquificaceae bacterium]|nr:class I SAM-dependent DNA methyltransferase [Aquificaceae bacterium]MDW8423980.1 class I SAM-dependent DNA methyltransferase [Aquificaceae bacterium]
MVLEKLLGDFSVDAWKDFLSKKFPDHFEWRKEIWGGYEDDRFELFEKLGEGKLEDTNVVFFCIKTSGELQERSSKKAQFEKARALIKDSMADAGLFTFYDQNGNLRVSLVFRSYTSGKENFSYYRRYTYYIQKGKPYRTFLKAFEGRFEKFSELLSAFSLQPLTKEFFTEIQNWYAWAQKHAWFPDNKPEENLIRLITRLIFVWFLKEKKLIPEEIFQEEFLKGVVKDFGRSDNY